MKHFALKSLGDQMIWKQKHSLRHCFTVIVDVFSRVIWHGDILKQLSIAAQLATLQSHPNDTILTVNTFSFFIESLETKEEAFRLFTINW